MLQKSASINANWSVAASLPNTISLGITELIPKVVFILHIKVAYYLCNTNKNKDEESLSQTLI